MEVRLRLAYDPTVANAPRFADDMVKAAEEISGLRLDYSVDSLKDVDALLEAMRRDGMTTGEMGETIFGFGCYVGEVFVRVAGARWVDRADSQLRDIARFPIVIDLGDGSLCDPIARAFDRLDHGMDHSLPSFFQAAAPATAPTRTLHGLLDRILPRLKPSAFVQGVGADLVRRPVDGLPLYCVYCIDEEENVSFIDRWTVASSAMDEDTLHALALSNLEDRFHDVGSSRVDLQACKLEYSIVSPK